MGVATYNKQELVDQRVAAVNAASEYLGKHLADWNDEHEGKHGELLAVAEGHRKKLEAIERQEKFQEGAEEAAKILEKPLGRKTAPDAVADPSEIFDPEQPFAAQAQAGGEWLGEHFDIDVGPERKWRADERIRASRDYSRAFWKALLTENDALSRVTGDEKALLQEGQYRADLQSDSAADGGYLTAPMQFAAGLIKALDQALPLRAKFRQFTVRTADSLGIRKRTAKSSVYARGPEIPTSQAYDSNLKFGQKVLTPHYWSAAIKLSRDLIRRAVQSVEQIAIEELTVEIGEGQEAEFVTGGGDQEPLGLFTASADGISTARDVVGEGFTTAVLTFEGLLDCKYSVLRYWRNSEWGFHPNRHRDIAKIFDTTGQPIWLVSTRVGEPDILLGLPVFMHESFPSATGANLYAGMVGDFSYYYLAESLLQDLQRLVEKYAEQNQIALLVRGKNDGMPVLEEAFARIQFAAV